MARDGVVHRGEPRASIRPGASFADLWKCGACQHVWQTAVAGRGAGGSGCPACAGQAVTPRNSLRALFPELAREWHPTKTGALTRDPIPVLVVLLEHVLPGGRYQCLSEFQLSREPLRIDVVIVRRRC